MSTVMTTVERWQDEFIDIVDRIEEPVVKWAGEFAESMVDYVPERPDWAMLERVPTVTEVVENQLAFTSRFVEDQVAFVRKLMKAMSPALKKMEPSKAPARKVTPKAQPKSA
jgi:hypothetical protein